MTTPATSTTQTKPRGRRSSKPGDDAAAANPNILCHQIGLCRDLGELQTFIKKHDLLNVSDDPRFDERMRVVIEEALDTMAEVLQNPDSETAALFPVPADLAAKGWTVERDGVGFLYRRGQLATSQYVIRAEAADAARKLHTREGKQKEEGRAEFVEPTVTEVEAPRDPHATTDLKHALQADGWKFRDYADGRWMGTHKARGLKTGKSESLVEVIHEAARLAEARTAEIEDAGSHAEAAEGSAYEGQDAEALLAATENEQRGRWQTLKALHGSLTSLAAKPRKLKKAREEITRLSTEYDATYSEVADAAGQGAALDMRERVETEFKPDDVPASADPATSGETVEDTPAIAATPVDSPAAEPRTFRDTFDVKLDDHDIASKARTLSLLRLQIEELQAEMKKTVEGYKARIGGLEEQCVELFKAIRRGYDELDLEVYEERDYDNHTVKTVRADSGVVVATRAMTPAEYQQRLPSI